MSPEAGGMVIFGAFILLAIAHAWKTRQKRNKRWEMRYRPKSMWLDSFDKR